MWERAALPTSERTSSDPERARRSPARTPDRSAQDLRRARDLRARARTATLTGLVLSALCSVPVGWSFVQSTFLVQAGVAAEECPDLASFLAPALKGTVRGQQATGGLSNAASRALSVRVCGSAAQTMLRPLLEGVSDLQGLRDLAKGAPLPDGDIGAMPALRTLLARPGP